MKEHPMESGKNLSVLFNADISGVSDMILEHWDDKEPEKTIILNWPFYEFWDIKTAPFEIHPMTLPGDNPGGPLYDLKRLREHFDKIILFESEHLPFWVMNYMTDEYLDDVDEIWLPWLESFEFFKTKCTKQWDKLRFVPMRYHSGLMKDYTGNSGKYDHNLGFFGQMSHSRRNYWGVIESQDWSIYHINGMHPREIPDKLKNTRFILDIPFNYFDDDFLTSQNVVRIFEMIGMGKHVLTMPVTFNYFPEMVTIMEDSLNFVPNLKNLHPFDYSLKYKEMTFKDDDYEQYKSDCIKRYNDTYGNPFDQNAHLNVWIDNPHAGLI